MKNIFLVIFSFVIVATTLSFHTTKAQAASWLEQELDGNEPYIQATERTLSKNRDDITLADLEAITSLSIYQSSDIPDKISDYKNLKFLVSQRLASTEIPNSIGQLKKLETLRLEYNNLQKFPRVVFQLPSLRILNLTHGNITEIPTEITGLSSHLRQLDIKENKLVTIPTSIFTTDWKAGFEHKLILGTARNQITSDIPAGYLYGIDYGGNMLEFYNLSPIKQDQLIYTGNSIVVPLNTNFNQLKPDKTQLGLQSGKALFANHTFIYHDDGTSNNVLTNGVATHRGNGYITIKSSNSTNSNPFAKVRVPITVTDPIAGQDVTVRYVDGAGNELAPTDILSGNVGDTYTSTAKDIEGWLLETTPENATGTFSDTAQTVTYVYEKEVVAGQDVTVRYADGAGNELAPTDTLSGNVGDTYTSTAKDIEGWLLETAPENAIGTFSDTAQTVTYVYEKEVVA
ncbi:MucBP domain-containing protein, partial [Listeria immobilis]|uniref:MucBP domain-containing protein n=2 Tax=Listeria immobilis TaxID=2713502 RepID=UPI001625381B